MDDKEITKAIEDWTGHSNKRIEPNVTVMLLALALNAIISFVCGMYFIIKILCEACTS